jgi:threonine/homoserine/homoserine lactone efflux protein
METGFFLKGLALGASIAAPVGPIGILCIRRSLRDGPRAGFVAGLGAATADAAYGAVAGFGLTAVSGFLVRQQFWLGLLGGLFLCYLGVRTFLSRPAPGAGSAPGSGLIPVYASTLLLTVSNPATILSFAAVFAGCGLGQATGYAAAGALVAGVFAGSALWWLLLSGAVGVLRERVTPNWMRAINRVSGCILLGFGIFSLSRALR